MGYYVGAFVRARACAPPSPLGPVARPCVRHAGVSVTRSLSPSLSFSRLCPPWVGSERVTSIPTCPESYAISSLVYLYDDHTRLSLSSSLWHALIPFPTYSFLRYIGSFLFPPFFASFRYTYAHTFAFSYVFSFSSPRAFLLLAGVHFSFSPPPPPFRPSLPL